jgi:hypothetical protein
MKVCYCDESGTGDEPIAVMVGVICDSQRMHITKKDWAELLSDLSEMTGREITEIHTRNFYAGNGAFRNIDGPTRARIITRIIGWIAERKHKIVYTSVCRETYRQQYALQRIPDELNTFWRFMGFHLVLALQKYGMTFEKTKGNTILILDNEEREQLRFTDVLCRPPSWSDEYYGRKRKQEALDQIIDVPYFGDSQEVSLIQVADFLAFFLRRYAEIKEDLVPPRYAEEGERIDGWITSISELSIGRSFIYRRTGRTSAEDMFFQVASESIRSLG